MGILKSKMLGDKKCLEEYREYLRNEERSENTISKYVRDIRSFFVFLGKNTLSKDSVLCWKEYLQNKHAPASVNSMLAAANNFFEWRDLQQLKVKPLKIQRAIYLKPEKELTYDEYKRLVRTAEKNKDYRLSLLIQTICATGIRISELRYITVEALHHGCTMADCKGKNRMIFIPKNLCVVLKRFCKGQGIRSGIIFRTRTGGPINRTNIWRAMKQLCEKAQVEHGKVFPHNLRHLFAKTYYHLEKDLSRLADLLGHSSISTTRIYTMESGKEHIKQVERMKLVLAQT